MLAVLEVLLPRHAQGSEGSESIGKGNNDVESAPAIEGAE